MPEDLRVQVPHIKEVVSALGLPVLEKEGYEADDLIATLARKLEREGVETVIVSGDKDLMQLVSSHVTMYDSMKDKTFQVPEVKERFGVSPDKVVEVMGLMGDTSDNIPGVPGIGPKTAAPAHRRVRFHRRAPEECGQSQERQGPGQPGPVCRAGPAEPGTGHPGSRMPPWIGHWKT